jgi:hypothetical protein
MDTATTSVSFVYRSPLSQLAHVCLARVVHHSIDEPGHVDQLHLHDEGGPHPVPAPHVQDGELGSQGQRLLLAGQVLNGLDGPFARALQQVVEQPPQEVRVRTEDAPEDEVILQVRERHTLLWPWRRLPRKGRMGLGGNLGSPSRPS